MDDFRLSMQQPTLLEARGQLGMKKTNPCLPGDRVESLPNQ